MLLNMDVSCYNGCRLPQNFILGFCIQLFLFSFMLTVSVKYLVRAPEHEPDKVTTPEYTLLTPTQTKTLAPRLKGTALHCTVGSSEI